MNELLPVILTVLGIFESITMTDVITLVVLVIIGVIIILLLRLLIMLIPAVLLALVVWFLTGSMFWAGITFLVVAALSLLKKVF
jgi:hypothetical protein